MDKREAATESRGQVALTRPGCADTVRLSPEGPSDTNGGDRINAHVSGRFLRALRFPATYDPAVAPLLLAAAGGLALGVAIAILRGFGPRYRVGRLLAAAPKVPVAEAVRLAGAGERRYVRVDGRIDSDAEFEDADHRPLVYRRTTVRWRSGRSAPWTTDEVRPEVVPFVVREGLDEIEVDAATLAEGLIVVPREHVGRVADLGESAPAGAPGDAEASIVIEQVSTVEHATVAGVPARSPSGGAVLGPGLGRPLLLTTLEQDEAMRVLTGGDSRRARVAVACLTLGAVLIAAAALWWLIDGLVGGGAATALAASPDPTLRPGADTRSPGQGPGLVGEPLLAILAMLGIGLLSAAGTLAWIRLMRRR